MSNLKRIINWFPRQESLTEVSILSVYEILLYIFVFFACFWIYDSWTTIPIKTTTINCERIDTCKLYIHSSEYDSYNKKYVDKKIPANTKGVFTITIPYCSKEIDYRENEYTGNCSFIYKADSAFSHVNDYNFMRSAFGSLSKYGSLDSLYNHYNENRLAYIKNHNFEGKTNDSQVIFYTRLIFEQNARRFSVPRNLYKDTIMDIKDRIESEPDYCYFESNLSNNRKHFQFAAERSDDYFYSPLYWEEGIIQRNGIFSHPVQLDNCDISQCYYRFKIHSNTVDTVELILNFIGANEFIYVLGGIPKKVDGQSLLYKIPHPKNKEIILHVKSKEFENIQNARIFVITAILSGLIVIFLTFAIIFFYRLGRYIKAKKKSKRELKKEMADSVKILSDGVPTEVSNVSESPNEEQVEQTTVKKISANNGAPKRKRKRKKDKSSNNNKRESSKN